MNVTNEELKQSVEYPNYIYRDWLEANSNIYLLKRQSDWIKVFTKLNSSNNVWEIIDWLVIGDLQASVDVQLATQYGYMEYVLQ